MKLYSLIASALLVGAIGTFATTHHDACSSCSASACGAMNHTNSSDVSSSANQASISPVSLTRATAAATEKMGQSANEAAAQFTTYEDAFRTAREDNKLVMIDVYTDWCGWCKRLDKDVYTDPEVQKQMKTYFAATKLNAESAVPHSFGGKTQPESAIASTWGVTGYPTIMFMTPDERIVQVIPGYLPAKDFALALRFVGSGAYKTTNFKDWKQSNS